jgi:hypothetical protein
MAPTIRTVDLVRSWLGQALRATGAAVVVPVAILVALSLTAIGGSGLGGLGALSQIVSGPRVPGSDVAVDDGDSEIGDAVTQLAASGPGGLAGAPGAVTPPGAVPGPDGGDDDAPSGSLPPPGGNDGPGGGGDIDPAPPGGGGGGGTPAPPEPPPPPQSGIVEGVGQTVTDVTSGTPLGPTVEDAVDGLVEVCGRLGCP